MLDRTVAKNISLYAVYQALRYVAPVVLTPFLAHVLSKSGFSDLVVLNSCIWTSTVFMEFGFYLYGVSKTAAALDREELSRVVTAITLGKLMLAPIALAVYVGLAAWAGLLWREPGIVAIGALSAFGYGASFAWFFQGQQRGGAAAITEAIPQAAYYTLMLLLVHSPGHLWRAVLIQTLPPLASLIAGLVMVRKTGLFRFVDLSAIKLVMTEALPFFVERFCFTLYTAVTPTLIAVLSTASEASYYSIGDRVGIFLGTVSAPLFQATVPVVAKRVRQNGTGGWRFSLALVAAVTLLVALLALISWASISLVITRFFSPDFRPAILVARFFCVTSVISVAGMALANFIIIPRNAAGVMIWSSSAALIMGFISQLSLVPRYGAIGAVLSRGLSETVVAAVLAVVVLRLYRQVRYAGGSTGTTQPEAVEVQL